MKNYQLLFLSIIVALLTACGSGGSGGSSSSTAGRNNLPHQYDVKPELKQAVRDSLKVKVDWDPAKGHQSDIIDGKVYKNGDFIYLTDFDLGYSTHDESTSRKNLFISKSKLRVYRLPYSVILATTVTDATSLVSYNDGNKEDIESYGADSYAGYLTKDLPQTGSANYVGKSFYNDETGNLKLSVNFGEKAITGGEITGLSVGKVTFKPGKIEPLEYEGFEDEEVAATGFKGDIELANANSKLIEKYTHSDKSGTRFKEKALGASNHRFGYEGHFFGPNAEEAAGDIDVYEKRADGTRGNYVDTLINFAGQRGKIKKP